MSASKSKSDARFIALEEKVEELTTRLETANTEFTKQIAELFIKLQTLETMPKISGTSKIATASKTGAKIHLIFIRKIKEYINKNSDAHDLLEPIHEDYDRNAKNAHGNAVKIWGVVKKLMDSSAEIAEPCKQVLQDSLDELDASGVVPDQLTVDKSAAGSSTAKSSSSSASKKPATKKDTTKKETTKKETTKKPTTKKETTKKSTTKKNTTKSTSKKTVPEEVADSAYKSDEENSGAESTKSASESDNDDDNGYQDADDSDDDN
jgi:hypothetical protein